jgi:DNA-binding NtrC family response regulator
MKGLGSAYSPPQPWLSLSRPQILIVDEEVEDLSTYCTILSEQGYLVWPVSSYAGGVACLKSAEFDMVIVSQGSPAFEGRVVVEQAIEQNRHTPVLVVTRCLDMSCYVEAMQLGATDYLEKPLKPSDLAEWAKAHVAPIPGLFPSRPGTA